MALDKEFALYFVLSDGDSQNIVKALSKCLVKCQESAS